MRRAGEFVDDDDFVVIDQVVLAAVEVSVNGPLDDLVELVRGVRVRTGGRVGAADFLAAGLGAGRFFWKLERPETPGRKKRNRLEK